MISSVALTVLVLEPDEATPPRTKTVWAAQWVMGYCPPPPPTLGQFWNHSYLQSMWTTPQPPITHHPNSIVQNRTLLNKDTNITQSYTDNTPGPWIHWQCPTPEDPRKSACANVLQTQNMPESGEQFSSRNHTDPPPQKKKKKGRGGEVTISMIIIPGICVKEVFTINKKV